jgi:hypothetical protein
MVPPAEQHAFTALKGVANAISREYGGPTPSKDPVTAVNARFGIASHSALQPAQYSAWLNEILYAFQDLNQYRTWAVSNPSAASGTPFPVPLLDAFLADPKHAAVAAPYLALGLAGA